MKNLKTFKTISIFAFALFISTLMLESCSKNDDQVVTPLPIAIASEQDPLNGYLITSGLNQVTTTALSGTDFEAGYSFIPLVNGKITAIVVKIPNTRLALRVTIWDKATGAALRAESLNITSTNIEVTKTITSLNLIKDKEYIISMNTNDLYRHTKTDGSNPVYPFIVGDLKITSFFIGASSTPQVIPNIIIANQYAGDCSFKFQK